MKTALLISVEALGILKKFCNAEDGVTNLKLFP